MEEADVLKEIKPRKRIDEFEKWKREQEDC
jgi:hypothetical protein